MKRDTQRKAVEILQAISEILEKQANHVDARENNTRPVIGFDPDVWGLNTWTVILENGAHTHVGGPGDDFVSGGPGSFEILVDSLHGLLCKGEGLSWA